MTTTETRTPQYDIVVSNSRIVVCQPKSHLFATNTGISNLIVKLTLDVKRLSMTTGYSSLLD